MVARNKFDHYSGPRNQQDNHGWHWRYQHNPADTIPKLINLCILLLLLHHTIQSTIGLATTITTTRTNINLNTAMFGPTKEFSIDKRQIRDLATNSSLNVTNKLERAQTSSDHNQTSLRLDVKINSTLPTSTNGSSGGGSSSSSSSGDRPKASTRITLRAVSNMANIVIFVVGSISNALVILVISKFTRTVSVTDIYILNLAFADIAYLFGLLFLIITEYKEYWIFGSSMCTTYMAVTSVSQLASSFFLAAMSFDRFLAVCHPIDAQRLRQIGRAKTMCGCLWLIAFFLMIPMFRNARLEKLDCIIVWPESNDADKQLTFERAFILYSFTVGFVIPSLFNSCCYWKVWRKVNDTASASTRTTRQSARRESANKRMGYLVVTIIITYIVCWAPYWATQLYICSLEKNQPAMSGTIEFFFFASNLAYTNSALNPILYAFLSDNFKRRVSDYLNWMSSYGLWPKRFGADSQVTVTTACNGSGLSRPNSRQAIVHESTVESHLKPRQHFEMTI